MGFFRKINKPVLSNRLKESGNVFMMLFGAIGMVGVIGASTMTVMKGPVKTMANVTKRTVAENNMIATGKLAIIAAQSQTTTSCDSDSYIEPLPYGTAIGASGGGTLPASIGVAKQDPWGNEYIYCAWDHGDEIDTGGCSGDNRRAGFDGATEYVLAVISAGPDRNLETTCNDYAGPNTTIAMTSGADDLILGYTYEEATAVSGSSIWSLDGADAAAIAKDISIKDKSTGLVESFAFDSDLGALKLSGASASGEFPLVKTDNLQSISGNIDVLSPLENTTGVLDIADDVLATGNISGVDLAASGTLGVTGISTLGVLNAGASTLGATDVDSLDAGSGAIVTTGTLGAGASTLGDTTVGTLGTSGLATLESTSITNNATVGGTLGVTGNSTLSNLVATGTTSLGVSDVDGALTITDNSDISGANVVGEGALVIQNNPGDNVSIKLRIDANELQASGNGIASTFHLNTFGGDVLIGTAGNANLRMESGKIIGLANPTASTDAANKDYVDTAVSGIDISGAETDPTFIKPLTANKWCGVNAAGTKVECNLDTPSGSDNLGNHTATTALNLATNKIVNLADPTAAADAATKSYVDSAVVAGADDLGNHIATTNLNLATNNIINVADPVNPQDAVTKAYLEGELTNVCSSGGGGTWTAHPAPDGSWLDVIYAGGQYVAVANGGTNRVMTSPDGETWTPQTISNFAYMGVAYGNGVYVAKASSTSGGVVTSPDGVNWTLQSGISGTANWQSMEFGNGLFVAISSAGVNNVATSTNGVTWTERSGTGATPGISIAYGAGKFVKLGNGPTLQTSTDGITWTTQAAPPSGTWYNLAYENSLFVATAISGTNRIMTSTDGITWTVRTAPEANTWGEVTYANGKFYAISSDGANRVMTSTDGATWTSESAAEQNGWYGIASDGTTAVAVSFDGTNRVMTKSSGGGSSCGDNLGDHIATQDIDLGTNKLVGNGGTEGISIAADGRIAINGTPVTTTSLSAKNITTTTENWKQGVQGTAYSWGSSASYNGTVAVSGYAETAATGAGIAEAYGIYGQAKGTNDAKRQYLYGVTGELTTHDTDYGYSLRATDDNTSTGGTNFGLYIDLDDTDVTRYGVYQNSANDNYFAGAVGIGDVTPDTGLKLDVEGKIGATEYCDENGLNCIAAAALGSGGGGSGTGYLIGDYITSHASTNVTTNNFVFSGIPANARWISAWSQCNSVPGAGAAVNITIRDVSNTSLVTYNICNNGTGSDADSGWAGSMPMPLPEGADNIITTIVNGGLISSIDFYEGGGSGGGGGGAFMVCTNENTDGDGTDDIAGCIEAATLGTTINVIGTANYRPLSCTLNSPLTFEAGAYFQWDGTNWLAWNSSSYSNCIDGTMIIANINGGGGGAGDGDTLADLSCTDGQVAEWDNTGSAWVCATPTGGAADNLGDHTATQDLDMATNNITNIGDITSSGQLTLTNNGTVNPDILMNSGGSIAANGSINLLIDADNSQVAGATKFSIRSNTDVTTGGTEIFQITDEGTGTLNGKLHVGYGSGASDFESMTIHHDADSGGGLFFQRDGSDKFVGFSGFEGGDTKKRLFVGGGGWNVHDMNELRFYTDPAVPTVANNAGLLRMTISQEGDVIIGTDTSASADLKLDVAGKVGATEYCDENGANCIAAALLGSGGGGGYSEEVLISSPVPEITFENIPAGTTELELFISNITSDTSGRPLCVQFGNGTTYDTGAGAYWYDLNEGQGGKINQSTDNCTMIATEVAGKGYYRSTIQLSDGTDFASSIQTNGARTYGNVFDGIGGANTAKSHNSIKIKLDGSGNFTAGHVKLVAIGGSGGGGSDTLAGLSCTDGQVAEWDNTGSAWVCATVSGSGDNLGNHTATQNLAMGGFDITGAGKITASTTSAGQVIYGATSNTAGKGVFGYASATTGNNMGVYGETKSVSGTGVFGWADSATGFNIGTYGGTASTTGYGLLGQALGVTGVNYGVHGSSASATGFGGYFTNTNGGKALQVDGIVNFVGVAGNAPTK